MLITGLNILVEEDCLMKKITQIFCVFFILSVLVGCVNNSRMSSVDSTEDKTTTTNTDEQIERDILNIYSETIEDYKKLVEFRLSDTFEEDYNSGKFIELNDNLKVNLSPSGDYSDESSATLKYKWDSMIVDMLDYINEPTLSSFGYIYKDLDSNGLPELFWVSSDYNVVFAVFTIKDNTAHLLDAYWPRYKTVVLDSDELYTLGSSSASIVEYTISTIDANEVDGIKVVQRFGSNGESYYEMIDEKSVVIGEDRFYSILTENPFEFGEKWRDNKLYILQ